MRIRKPWVVDGELRECHPTCLRLCGFRLAIVIIRIRIFEGKQMVYRNSQTENRCWVSHGVHNFVRADIVHFYHVVETTGQQSAGIAIERDGGNCLLVI